MKDKRLPNFVVIGAMKAGTTSLHYYLGRHPEISMPKGRKELDFFNNDSNWDKGVEWYRSQFENNALIKGEVSPNYTMSCAPGDDKVPRRMYSVLPDVSLIYILRDPVERMLSYIHHQWHDGRENRELDEIIDDTQDRWNYCCYGKYYAQLTEFLRYYNRERLLIITLEKLKKNPKDVMSSIFNFLSVDNTFYEDSFSTVMHASSDKKAPGELQRKISCLPVTHPAKRLHNVISSLAPSRISGFICNIAGRTIPKPVLKENQEARLIEYFSEDVASLRKLTGFDFAEWKYRYP